MLSCTGRSSYRAIFDTRSFLDSVPSLPVVSSPRAATKVSRNLFSLHRYRSTVIAPPLSLHVIAPPLSLHVHGSPAKPDCYTRCYGVRNCSALQATSASSDGARSPPICTIEFLDIRSYIAQCTAGPATVHLRARRGTPPGPPRRTAGPATVHRRARHSAPPGPPRRTAGPATAHRQARRAAAVHRRARHGALNLGFSF